MSRLWIIAAAVLFVLVWFFFIKVMAVLAIVLAVGGGAWIWWEIRQFRKAVGR